MYNILYAICIRIEIVSVFKTNPCGRNMIYRANNSSVSVIYSFYGVHAGIVYYTNIIQSITCAIRLPTFFVLLIANTVVTVMKINSDSGTTKIGGYHKYILSLISYYTLKLHFNGSQPS